MKRLKFEEIKVGSKVIDSDGVVGTIKEVDDPHNIFVSYTKPFKGSGFYCMIEECEEYNSHCQLFSNER